MKIGIALRELHESETELGRTLVHVAERHRVDHELFHLGRDLAEWSGQHVREIARVAEHYGEHLDPAPGVGLEPPESHAPGLVDWFHEKGSELTGRSSSPGLLMLRDLRDVYLKASGVYVDWEMLGQAAQAIQHDDLLAVSQRCRQQTLRQLKWANAKIKESSTQVLAS